MYSFLKRTKPLSFPVVDKPTVSIIIPVYNKHLFTFNCLRAVLKESPGIPYEVIVVDDCSSDKTPHILSQISGIRVIRNPSNQGFLHSCNRGANVAKGEYLVFLNNDAIVTKQWLEELLKTFETFPEAGLVGAKLIYPDGRLQEAGGIIWNDGSGWNYGRWDDPHKPQYNYLRAVDYCSGACVMVRAKIYRAIGGFDVRYAPAYYEDTDLAFEVRNLGYKVFYQPRSQVIHFEGISSGTNIGSGVKKYQETNRHKFLLKWGRILTSHGSPGKKLNAERERWVRKRILVIDACLPTPDRDSGSLRMHNLLLLLRGLSHKITFAPDNLKLLHPYADNLQAAGIEVLYGPYVPSIEQHLREHGGEYDVVMLSRVDVAEKHIDSVRQCAPQAAILFDTVDLHFLREGREAKLKRDLLLEQRAEKRKKQELRVAQKADGTLVVSPDEKEILQRECGQLCVQVVPNIHEICSSPQPFGQRKDILFVGGFNHPPNVEAVIYFVGEIFPSVRAKIRGIKLYVVGNNPPSSIRKLATDDVVVMGYVADISAYFHSAKLSVAPLLYGAGVKGKVTMSLSYGVPVVATSIAAEGTHAVHGVSALIADEPREFAKAVECLYQDEEMWNRLSKNGLSIIAKYFSFKAVTTNVEKMVNELQPGGTLLRSASKI